MKKLAIILSFFIFAAILGTGAMAVKNSVKSDMVLLDDDPKKQESVASQTETSVSGEQPKDSTSCAQKKDATCAEKKESCCAHKSADAGAGKENCCSKTKSAQSQVMDEKK